MSAPSYNIRKELLLKIVNERILSLKEVEAQQAEELKKQFEILARTREELEELHKAKDDIETRIYPGQATYLEGELQESVLAESLVYEPDSSWPAKAVYVLSSKNKGLSMREILEGVYEVDAKLNEEKEDLELSRKHLGVLSPTIKQAAKRRNVILREFSTERGEFIYYLARWTDETGFIKEKYK